MKTTFLDVDDFTPEQFARTIRRAAEWKRGDEPIPQLLRAKGVALLFEKPSARTRTSTEMGVVTLGGHPVYIRPEEVGLDTRETTEDVARTLAGYCDVIAARTFSHATLERMAAVVSVPVVNLLSDTSHPCQAVADVLTLSERWGAIDGRRIAYIGDGNNVAASLALASAMSGMTFSIATPLGYELPSSVVARVEALGGTIDATHDPRDGIAHADAVYADVWTSMGQEAEQDQRLRDFSGFQIDAALMELAQPDAVFLHCLPAHRGQEVSADVIDGPKSLIWKQAANRMDAVRSVIVELLERI